jgi:hypothetical protein
VKKKALKRKESEEKSESSEKSVDDIKPEVVIQEIEEEDLIEHEILLPDKKALELKDINKKFDL